MTDIRPTGKPLQISLILFLAAILRVIFLSKESLWIDESATWWLSSGDIHRALGGEPTTPPLYYLLLHFWVQWFGTSEAALRSLSILPGVASVFVVYLMARRLFSAEIGMLAALFQAISSFHVFYAQEARAFALLNLFIVLSVLFLVEALNSSDGRRSTFYFAVYALATALSLYTHFISVFFVAAHALYVFLRRPRAARMFLSWCVSAAIAVLLFLPWLAAMLKAAGGGGQVKRYLLLKLPQAYFSFIFGDTLIPLDERAVQNIAGTLTAYLPILIAAVASLVILAPFCLSAFRRRRDGALVVVIMAVVPVLLCFGVSFKIMMFDERYLIGASSFVYVAIAAGAQEAFRRLRDAHGQGVSMLGSAAAAMYAGLAVLSLYNYYFGARFGKEQWREAVAFIESRSLGSELVVLEPDYLRYCYYYYRTKDMPYLTVTADRRRAVLSHDPKMTDSLRRYDGIWLVRSHYDDDQLLLTLRALFPRQVNHAFFPKAKGIEVIQIAPGS